ncbi:MAG: hypothetical protein BGN97_13260 [Microbacterium sp. 69-10]|uniref:MFS transporter n=1 Tax=Microbacterium sp. 69-10 TaxID=1895783 RepID=UPI000963E63E|nr:MFS transporter [Microbacterium sp. 69-10]OJU41386.1 MAG: hypothetical protein BGN97_13260 [Microbacterium sp. 69-10]
MTSTTVTRARLPLNTFGIAFGTAGLAGTWTTAGELIGAPTWTGDAVWAVAAAAWAIITVTYLRRSGRLRGIAEDLRHPVLGPFGSLFPAVGSLLAAHLTSWSPVVAAIGVWSMVLLATGLGAWFVATLMTVPRNPGSLHGGYLLPTVAGSLIASQSLAVIGQRQVAIGYLAVGVLFWLLVGAVLIGRFMVGPATPAGLLPTLAIFSAPPAVAGNALWAITGGRGSEGELILGALMIALLLPHVFLVRQYAQAGFALGFWAMTFTVAASATYGIRLLSLLPRTGVTVAASWLTLAAATVFIGTIAVRSLGLLHDSESWRTRAGSRLYRNAGLAGVVVASVAVAFGAGAGSPLLIVYQAEWGFPDWQLTAAFTVYAMTLLGTLLVAGRLSDFVGRRPVLLAALTLMLLSSMIFLYADGIAGIIVARAVQGVATGAATSTFTAAIIELSSPRRRGFMTVVTSAAPVGGLALGAFGGGLAAEFSDDPTRTVFLSLGIAIVTGMAAVFLVDETAGRRPGAIRSLRPAVAVPADARAWFASLAPLTAAGWMYSGLFLGLAPRFDEALFGVADPAVNAAIVALQPASSAVAGILFTRMPARSATRVGASLLVVGAAGAVIALITADLPLMLLAALVGGAGQGAAFGSSLRLLGPLASNASRGGMLSGVYLIAYTAYGLPVLIAGALSAALGLLSVSALHAAVVGVLAATAFFAVGARARRDRADTPADDAFVPLERKPQNV